ncbi:MAG: hypothetical protein QM770_24000 [Tepidisphaeraceae bacterium]
MRLDLRNHFARLLREDHGGEIMEYVLIAGLVIISAATLVAAFGTKLVARWNSANNQM